MACGSCGQKYKKTNYAPSYRTVKSKGTSRGVIKSPQNIPVAGDAGPANKLENKDEK